MICDRSSSFKLESADFFLLATRIRIEDDDSGFRFPDGEYGELLAMHSRGREIDNQGFDGIRRV